MDEFPVDRQLETAAIRRHEHNLGDLLRAVAGKVLDERSRQTDGSRGVVSNDAKFDADLHAGLLTPGLAKLARWFYTRAFRGRQSK